GKAFDPAAILVRRAILREAGLNGDDLRLLTSGAFERPLPMWPLRIFAAGVLRASPQDVDPDGPPLIFDVVPEVGRTGFDAAAQSTEGHLTIRVRGPVDAA